MARVLALNSSQSEDPGGSPQGPSAAPGFLWGPAAGKRPCELQGYSKYYNPSTVQEGGWGDLRMNESSWQQLFPSGQGFPPPLHQIAPLVNNQALTRL